jgi:hypothetical protein
MPRSRGSDGACGAEEGGVGATPAGEGGPERRESADKVGSFLF